MTVLVIHCSRIQVAFLAGTFGKIHLERDGTKVITVPRWIERMYKAAKVEDYRHSYPGGNKMITHPY